MCSRIRTQGRHTNSDGQRHMVSSKGLDGVSEAANALGFNLVGKYTSLFTSREGRKRRWGGEGWREERQVVRRREASVCWLDSCSRNGLSICLPDGHKRRLGRGSHDDHSGSSMSVSTEASRGMLQRDGPDQGKTGLSHSHIPVTHGRFQLPSHPSNTHFLWNAHICVAPERSWFSQVVLCLLYYVCTMHCVLCLSFTSLPRILSHCPPTVCLMTFILLCDSTAV